MVSTRSAIREASGEPESLKQTRSRTASKSPRTVSPTQSAGSPERPVRRKLKNTKIDAEGDKATNTSSESGSIETTPDKASTNGDEPKSRGRPKKKRSFDELEDDKTDTKGSGTSSKQPRKRSRSDEGSEAATADSALDAKVVAEDMSQLETTMAPEADGKEQAAIAQAQEPEEQNVPNDPDAPPSRAARPPKLDVTSDEVETAIASPKNKRNRDSFIQDQSASTDTKARNAGPTDGLISTSEKESTPSTEEPDKKKLRDEKSSEAESLTKVAPASGFTNTSTTSPFGSLASPSNAPKAQEPDQPQTSSKAFASSGFASFASSSQSPFGGFGGTSTSTSTSKKEDEEPVTEQKADAPPSFSSLSGSKSPFASTSGGSFGSSSGFGGASGFGSAGGFGSTGSSTGFGGLGGKAPLTSWATNGASGIVGTSSKPAKPFGAPADEDEDEEEGETSEPEDNTIRPADEGTTDPRFKEQRVETGEEGEDTLFQSRAKLYVIDEKQWKERAVGPFKINVLRSSESNKDGGEAKKTARLIMRSDGSQRIMLNSPITSDINLRDPAGGPPKGKNALFMGFDKGSLRLMQLKLRNAQVTGELHQVVSGLLEEAESQV